MPVHPLQLSSLRHRIFNSSHNSRFPRLVANKAATVAAALTLTLTFAACGDTPGSIAAPEPPPLANPGLLIVEMRGLPAGLESSALVSGPNGFQQRVAGTDTLQGLKPGTYTVTAAPVPSGEGEWQPSQESQSIQINGGIRPQAIIISFDALIRRAQLSLDIEGLPAGVAAKLQLSKPNGRLEQPANSTTYDFAPLGNWTLDAFPVSVGAAEFTPVPASQTRVLRERDALKLPVRYSATRGGVAVAIVGLPSGQSGKVNLSGVNGFNRTLSGTATVTGLEAGSYQLSAQEVTVGNKTYSPSPANSSFQLVPNPVATAVTVSYSLKEEPRGSLSVSVSGLPAGQPASITVTGPDGYSKAVLGTVTLSGLIPGSYTVAAGSVAAGGINYSPSPATRTVSVSASGSPAAASVAYAAQTGSFKLTLSGLGGGTQGDLTLAGPGGYSETLSASTTLNGLPVGSYTLTARTVQAAGNSYAPNPASKTLSITSGDTTSQTVTYALASGSLAVSVSGLPSGTGASVSVTGPGGYSKSLSSTTTLSGLEPGSYTVAASSVSEGGVSYAPSPATRSVSVTASATAATAAVSYTAQTGSFKLALSGLPAGASGDITLTGPGGYSKHLSTATTLSGLAVGSYTLTASSVSSSSGVYTPSPASKSISITTGSTTSQSVSYSALPAVLKIPVSGLPGGATANITLTDPQGQTRSITATTTLSPAAAGRWRLAAQQVSTGSNIYAPSPASYDQTVLAGDTMSYPVSYSLASGSIAVSVSGLPAGASANISVSGPGGYSKTVTSTATLTGLTPGSYTVTAGSVSSGGDTFNASPATRSVNVTASTVAQAAPVTYTQVNNGGSGGGGNTPNLSVENVYLVQAAQNWEGTTPIVQGREALARVFVKAAAANTATPVVKLSIYSGSSLVSTINIPAAAAGVPTAISEGSISASWNVVIPAASVRANMQIRAELDPGNTLGESDRSDNLWPRGGGLSAVNITDPPPLSIKFVPVTVAGLTGNVSEANKEAWMEMMKQVYPLREVNASVRAPYVSNAGAFQSSDGNGSWSKVLSEVNVLRATDGVGSSTTHYFGVVKTSYGSGIAGIGYQPGRAAIGWDQPATYQRVFAHEIGHNFALGHAPCGVSGSSMYPYSGGKINVWGWNSRTNSVVPPSESDLMGYCSNQWISDWTISQVAARRAYTGGMIASAARTEGLLIWGRSSGAGTGAGAGAGAVLEPAFPVLAAPTGEPLNASHIAELYDAAGGLVASYRFEMEAVDHNAGEGQFATVVPLSAALQGRVSSIAIRAVGSPIPMAVQRSGASSLAAARGISEAQAVELSLPASSVRAGAGGRSVVEWNNSVFRMAMVRDRNTGEILSFLRQPGDEFQAGGRPVEIVFSDGTHSRVERR